MYGYIRTACATPEIALGDSEKNAETIASYLEEMDAEGVDVALFPPLSLTGYSIGDLASQQLLTKACEEEIENLLDHIRSDILAFIGLPLRFQGRILSAFAVLNRGEILALLTEETVHDTVSFAGGQIPLGNDIVLRYEETSITVGFDERYASLLLKSEAFVKGVGFREKNRRRMQLLSEKRGLCVTSCGHGESTTDFLYSGEQYIFEDGRLLEENFPIDDKGWIYADLDSELFTLPVMTGREIPVRFSSRLGFSAPERYIDPLPFVPKNDEDPEEILLIQSRSLLRRMRHIGTKKALLGLSGGLDSTLTLLVCVRAFEEAGWDLKDIHAYAMPGFGTSDTTKENGLGLKDLFPISFEEIDIREAVNVHFRDIGLEEGDHSVAFENAQARERTQILMDMANRLGGLVVGSGDLSELALGFTTFNGDHMSMYGVNANVPKTAVRALVAYEGRRLDAKVLLDIVETPVSPELLPGKDGEIAQKTEEIIGPYELHDFFLYHFLKHGYTPGKIAYLAEMAFRDEYDRAMILKTLHTFYRRFFASQYKRSTLPDGPQVYEVGLSPRGSFACPSDFDASRFLKEVDALMDDIRVTK